MTMRSPSGTQMQTSPSLHPANRAHPSHTPSYRQPSIQVEFAQWLSSRSVLGLAQRLGKLLVEEIFLVLLRVNRLTEDRLLALILLAHGLGRGFKVFKHPLARRGGVAHHQPC